MRGPPRNQPKPLSGGVRVGIAAVAAAFVAIMLAGPGMMFPGHFRLVWGPIACALEGEGLEPVVETSNYSYGRNRGTSYQFRCWDPERDRGVDVAGRAIGLAFCGYFVPLFLLLSVGFALGARKRR